MMRHAVTVFAATATLLVHVGEDMGHETVVYEVSCSMGHVGVGGLRPVRPMVSSVTADPERVATTAVVGIVLLLKLLLCGNNTKRSWKTGIAVRSVALHCYSCTW